MSTPTVPTPQPTNLTGILGTLTQINAGAQLVLSIGGVLVPLIVAGIKKIENPGGAQTVAYQVILTTEENLIDADRAQIAADIADLNAELARGGFPLIVFAPPPSPKPFPVPDPAPPAPSSGA